MRRLQDQLLAQPRDVSFHGTKQLSNYCLNSISKQGDYSAGDLELLAPGTIIPKIAKVAVTGAAPMVGGGIARMVKLERFHRDDAQVGDAGHEPPTSCV